MQLPAGAIVANVFSSAHALHALSILWLAGYQQLLLHRRLRGGVGIEGAHVATQGLGVRPASVYGLLLHRPVAGVRPATYGTQLEDSTLGLGVHPVT